MICWAWAIGGKEACKLLRPEGCKVTCVDGFVRFVKMVFEGDDSILSFFCYDPAHNMTSKFLSMLHQRWTKMGHRPKLFERKEGSVAEFTGWHFAVSPVGIDASEAAPDLFRNLTNMAFSINPAAVKAAVEGDKRALLSAVAPGVIARLYPMASRFPALCRLLAGQFGRHLKDAAGVELTRDEVYALELEPEDFGFKESEYTTDMDQVIHRATTRFQPILERFETQLSQGPEFVEEADLAERLGLVPSFDAYLDLLDVIEGGYFVGADSSAFQRSIATVRDGASS
jgi:hypothetical protein